MSFRDKTSSRNPIGVNIYRCGAVRHGVKDSHHLLASSYVLEGWQERPMRVFMSILYEEWITPKYLYPSLNHVGSMSSCVFYSFACLW